MRVAKPVEDKLNILNLRPEVTTFLADCEILRRYLDGLNAKQQVAIKSVIAIGQGPIVFQGITEVPQKLDELLETLMVLEEHYDSIGGIIGYHTTILNLLSETDGVAYTRYFHPPGIDLREDVQKAVQWGLQHLPNMGEIYPIGGAGDRLGLIDENGEALPAAKLEFGGHTLLEGLIRDLQAREYLYYKLFGEMLITPIAMMTSLEKDNHEHVLEICEQTRWWDRPKESFAFFTQERVPMLTEEGNWAVASPLELHLKPGGHGVLWKLMEDAGIFDWFASQQRTKALIRQINNPLAGTDHALLAFFGIGAQTNKAFGFAACDRKVGAAEGTLVLCEKENHTYGITNIEYPDFVKHHIQDEPREEGSQYSIFPANTNILFADLEAVREKVQHCPLPGMLINMKKTAPCLKDGVIEELHVGRLETTMQNIADYFFIESSLPIQEGDQLDLPTFVTYNERRKTLSVTKKLWKEGDPIDGTPIGAEHERQQNNHELLTKYCGMEVPSSEFHFTYHPALGPLWSIIGQKVQGGEITKGSELQLEIAQLHIQNLSLNGSLLIQSASTRGKCRLINVRIENDGIDWDADNTLWKNQIVRKEALEIILEGDGEFYANGVTFRGKERIIVPDGHCVRAEEENGSLVLKVDPLKTPWSWEYSINENHTIQIKEKGVHSKE